MKQIKGIESHKEHCFRSGSQERSFRGSDIWAGAWVEKGREPCRCVPGKSAFQMKAQSKYEGGIGLWLRKWSLEFGWLGSNSGSSTYISAWNNYDYNCWRSFSTHHTSVTMLNLLHKLSCWILTSTPQKQYYYGSYSTNKEMRQKEVSE